VKLYQIQVKLKCKLQGDQKIKIGVGIKLGLLLQQGQKMMYLNYGRLKV